jgi:hypothetical protein
VLFSENIKYDNMEHVAKDFDKHHVPEHRAILTVACKDGKPIHGWVISKVIKFEEPVAPPEIRGTLGSKAVERNVVLEMVKTVQTPPPGKRQGEPGSSQKATSSRRLVGEMKKPRSSNAGKALLHTLVKLAS